MEKQFEAVANWWAEQIFDKQGNWDNGDDSEAGGLAFVLGNMLKTNAIEKAGKDAKPKFIEALKTALLEHQQKTGQVWNCYADYHPDAFLAGAAAKAGMSSDVFPCKTGTTIRQDGSVWARCGYGAESICIFEKDLQETE